jgi:arylsulfatase B
LRGQKTSVWEGGCRVPACVYSPLIDSKQKVVNDLMHITDIFPSLASAANIEINDNSLDGIDQWNTIKNGEKTTRKEILYNIESVFGYSAVLNNEWKLVNGTDNVNYSGWFGSNGSDAKLTFEEYIESVHESEAGKSLPKLKIEVIMKMKSQSITKCKNPQSATKCDPLVKPCLFNVYDDPCEQDNLAEKYPEKVEYLQSRLKYHELHMVPTRRKPVDGNCDPKNFNYTWTWWLDEQIDDTNFEDTKNLFLFGIGIAIIFTFGLLIMNKMRNAKKYG